MSFRYPKGGFITAFYDPLQVPNAPTIGTATAGDAQATVAFTAPSNVGGSAITAYYAVSNPSQITVTGASSPITVTGLTNDTAYTFQVWALNSYGPSPFSAASGSVTPQATRGVFAGGRSPSLTNVIQYIEISTTGNATDFGDISVASAYLAGCASSTRGLFAGVVTGTKSIEYITISTTGDATYFGDLIGGTYNFGAACNSSTRGIIGVGSNSNVISYVTIASTGNAIDFGDLLNATTVQVYSSCSSPTRGIFAGGNNSGGTPINVIQYITIASTGNATDFGDLLSNASDGAACSNSTRGLIVLAYNGSSTVNNIEYITIATTGNATDFGDLTFADIWQMDACASSTRGVIGGGGFFSDTNVIQYVTIANTGNTTDFGDLIAATKQIGACSNGNGGL